MLWAVGREGKQLKGCAVKEMGEECSVGTSRLRIDYMLPI